MDFGKPSAILCKGKPLVLLEIIVSSLTTSAIRLNSCCLISKFSTTASITQSTSLR